MPLEENGLKIARERVTKVFQFLEAFNQLRNPVKRIVGEQSWVLWLHDLPDHPAVRIGVITEVPDDEGVAADTTDTIRPSTPDNVILQVSQPDLTPAPAPPPEIVEWLLPGWDRIDGAVQVLSSRGEPNETGQTVVVRFEDAPSRAQLLALWQGHRDDWVRNERPARDALRLFERLYQLNSQIERESEQVELVLGDGILDWQLPAGGIHHPILLLRLQMKFDPSVPQFTISETDRPVELYSAPLPTTVDGGAIGQCRKQLDQLQCHPLGSEPTDRFLRTFVQRCLPGGQFLGRGQPQGQADYPRVGRDPLLFLRSRTLGFAAAIQKVLEALQSGQDPPQSLIRLVGEETPLSDLKSTDISDPAVLGNEDQRILLSKPANPKQLQIAQRLEKYGSVLVQGPPGTGKTHTIGNLVGHLLAQGKTVLVTSHTTKALRMVRQQVVEGLRPLCVSVLERDAESREQLTSSIGTIVSKSSNDADQLDREATELRKRRIDILSKLREGREKLRRARADEYDPIVVAGENHNPSDAARKVADGQTQDSWIPGPVTPGAPLPLSQGELSELYYTNIRVTAQDERDLAAGIPSPAVLLSPHEFASVADSLTQLAGSDRKWRSDLWQEPHDCKTSEALDTFLQELKHAAGDLLDQTPWTIAAIDAGRNGGQDREPWDSLIRNITAVRDEAAAVQETLLTYGPSLADDESLDYQALMLGEIAEHLERGGHLGWWTLFTKKPWKLLLERILVGGKRPWDVEHFHALQALAHLTIARRELLARWERQMVPLGGPVVAELGDRPELRLAQFCQPLSDALDWYATKWTPLERDFKSHGFQWQILLKEMPITLAEHAELFRRRDATLTLLPRIFSARANRLEHERLEEKLNSLASRLSIQGAGQGSAQVVRNLRESVAKRDSPSYREAYELLVYLQGTQETLKKRNDLLRRLEASAPAWAAAVRDRRPPHDGRDLPGEPASAAWLWRQLYDELERRGSTSLEALQKEIAELTDQLQQVTSELIDRQAWAAQIRRTSLSQRQALTGWLGVTDKIGMGTSRQTPRRQAEARRLLSLSQAAVPVWIMPLARAVENFNPAQSPFDVVIIDEASQLDVMGLLALYMGKQVIVVGDNQQVSPEAVGLNLDQVTQLQEEFLIRTGIPNPLLYDGQTSVYDLAETCFGGGIRLVEHFRCAPEIIQFSNDLSYNGEIEPLRDMSSVRLKPHVLAYRVEGASSTDKVNETEALALASLLVAATEQPEYQKNEKGEPVSFGVISLVGEDQAFLIDGLLRRHLSPVEYDRRRIVCGNAAHFQGDERDVMFLSVVDGPRATALDLIEAEPAGRFEKGASNVGIPQADFLRMKQASGFQKRFNVAASRARDQMWVVHSLDPQNNLKPGDLRRLLIEHAQDPHALMQLLDRGLKRAESEFERQVLRRLVSAGYRVTSQWKVGYKRIDLVVEGGGKRLAVECDGDRYHPPEKWGEDMLRQAMLERLGWTFVRIRGTKFFRDPHGAMQPVFARLEALGIAKESPGPSAQGGNSGDSELRDRIVRRAEELRRDWQSSREPSSAQAPRILPKQGRRVTAKKTDSDPMMPSPKIGGTRQALPGLQQSRTPPVAAESDLLSYLSQRGLEIIDKRSTGGGLWVVGDQYLSGLMQQLRARGTRFEFMRDGAQVTGGRPAWFTT